jgi:FkbH-like protein
MLRTELTDTLRGCLPRDGRLAVVHSSLALLGTPSGLTRWDWMAPFVTLAGEGWTFAVPTFTFSFCSGKDFHWRDSPSETGILGDWLRSVSHARRSPHPIYSFALLGPLAEDLAAPAAGSTFGAGSIFARFEALDATYVMLGCDWHYCTQFHVYEEEAAVPYRWYKEFAGNADCGDGPRTVTSSMFVRRLDINQRKDFRAVTSRLLEAAAVADTPLWRGSIRVARCAEIARAALSADRFALLANPRGTEHQLKLRDRRLTQTPLRVAVLGSANVTLIAKALEARLPPLVPDRETVVVTTAFGQLVPQILAAGSELHAATPEIAFFVDRLEDLLSLPSLEGVLIDTAEAAVDRYADAIRAWQAQRGGLAFVHTLCRLAQTSSGLADHWSQTLVALQHRLRAALDDVAGINWIDLAAEAALHPGAILDDRLWHAGRVPFADGFSQHLARVFASLCVAATGRSARVIVLDLDNTLWGGVLGEDGLSGLQLGGDYPGNGFLSFQRVLKALSARGVALAIASKNDEALAVRTIADHPAMLLKTDDFVAMQIHWGPKTDSIQAIAAELNVSLDHVLFVDDNPVEREAVRRLLPAVKVLDLPEDPALYARALLNSPWLNAIGTTDEDRRRVGAYRSRRERERTRATFQDIERFYGSLQTKVRLQPIDAGTHDRALQLITKTNQFNTTTQRYARADLERIEHEGGQVIVIGVEDRFTAFENVGVIVLRPATAAGWVSVDCYLLSCRVLGRGLEMGLLRWLAHRLRSEGCSGLRGSVIPTARNAAVWSVFADAGFTAGPEEHVWELSLDTDRIGAPEYLHVDDLTRPWAKAA